MALKKSLSMPKVDGFCRKMSRNVCEMFANESRKQIKPKNNRIKKVKF